MKVQLNREDEKQETKNVIIHIGDTRYRISESIDGEIEINKHDLDDSNIYIRPQYSNQIAIK